MKKKLLLFVPFVLLMTVGCSPKVKTTNFYATMFYNDNWFSGPIPPVVLFDDCYLRGDEFSKITYPERIVAGDKLTINYTGDIVTTLSLPGRKSLNGKLVSYFYTQTTIFEETNVTKEYIKEHYTLKMEKVVTGDESNPVVVSLDEYTGTDYYLSFDLGSCPDCPKDAQCSPCNGRVVAAIYSYNPRP